MAVPPCPRSPCPSAASTATRPVRTPQPPSPWRPAWLPGLCIDEASQRVPPTTTPPPPDSRTSRGGFLARGVWVWETGSDGPILGGVSPGGPAPGCVGVGTPLPPGVLKEARCPHNPLAALQEKSSKGTAYVRRPRTFQQTLKHSHKGPDLNENPRFLLFGAFLWVSAPCARVSLCPGVVGVWMQTCTPQPSCVGLGCVLADGHRHPQAPPPAACTSLLPAVPGNGLSEWVGDVAVTLVVGGLFFCVCAAVERARPDGCPVLTTGATHWTKPVEGKIKEQTSRT